MRDSFTNVEHIAITTDVWTKRRTSFICLTGHTFNKKYQLVSVVLGFRRLAGQHLGDTIRSYIRYELDQLGIDAKICGITSDNGSDVKKATGSIEFGHRFWCIAHCLNLVVRNGLALWPKQKAKKCVTFSIKCCVKILHFLHLSYAFTHYNLLWYSRKNTASPTIMISTDPEESESEDDAKSEFDRLDVPTDVEDDQEGQTTDESSESDGSAEDEHDDDEDREQQEIVNDEPVVDSLLPTASIENTRLSVQKLTKRVRSCVNYIRNNRAINDYVRDRAGSNLPPIRAGLVIDFEVRWNSTYIMIDRFIIHRGILNEITTEPLKIPGINVFQQMSLRSSAFQFSGTDWSQLVDIHSLLKPFFVATNTISARNYPSLATAYSSTYILKRPQIEKTFNANQHQRKTFSLITLIISFFSLLQLNLH